MQIGYVELRHNTGRIEKWAPEPIVNARDDFEWACDAIRKDDKGELYLTESRPQGTGEGDVLKRSQFATSNGWIEVLLIDDGSW